LKGIAMAKKKAAKKAARRATAHTVLVYVPDAIDELGAGMERLIKAVNLFWGRPFGVRKVRVRKISTLPTANQTWAYVYVPTAIHDLGDSMSKCIAAVNFLWARAFQVPDVDVEDIGTLP